MAGYWTYLQDTMEIFYYHTCRNFTIKDVQFLNDFGGTWGDPDYCQSLGFYTTCVLLNSLDILHTLHMYFNTYTAGLMLDRSCFCGCFSPEDYVLFPFADITEAECYLLPFIHPLWIPICQSDYKDLNIEYTWVSWNFYVK